MPATNIRMSIPQAYGTNTDATIWAQSHRASGTDHGIPAPMQIFWTRWGNEQTSDRSRAWQIEPSVATNPWAAELNSLRRLAPNWDSYGSPAPNETALKNLAAVLRELYRLTDIPKPSIAPSAEGGGAVCFVDGAKYADIECFNDGSIFAVISNGADTPDVWPVGAGEIAGALEKIWSYLSA